MTKEKIKYQKIVAGAKKKWGKKSPEEKAAWNRMFRRGVERWILMWNILKRIEKEFHIDVMGIVREEIWKYSFSAGRNLAKKYKKHGVKELYEAFNAQFEGLADPIWLEFNDKVIHKWNRACPNYQHFKDLGWTDEQIKETAPYFCLQDIGIMTGFNPKLEVFPQSRLLMLGHSHCTYRVEDRGGK
jgi:hypothetical protein